MAPLAVRVVEEPEHKLVAEGETDTTGTAFTCTEVVALEPL